MLPILICIFIVLLLTPFPYRTWAYIRKPLASRLGQCLTILQSVHTISEREMKGVSKKLLEEGVAEARRKGGTDEELQNLSDCLEKIRVEIRKRVSEKAAYAQIGAQITGEPFNENEFLAMEAIALTASCAELISYKKFNRFSNADIAIAFMLETLWSLYSELSIDSSKISDASQSSLDSWAYEWAFRVCSWNPSPPELFRFNKFIKSQLKSYKLTAIDILSNT